MIPVNQENLARSAATAADTATSPPEGERRDDTTEDKQDIVAEVKGDPEMAPVFLRHLLPVFTHVFQGAMVQSVRYLCDLFALKYLVLLLRSTTKIMQQLTLSIRLFVLMITYGDQIWLLNLFRVGKGFRS